MLTNFTAMLDNDYYENMNYRGNISPFSNSVDSRDSTSMSERSPMSTSMSPMSGNMSSPESAHYTLNEMEMNLNDCINMNINHAGEPLIEIFQNMNSPYLEILEQPVDKFRFRYRSEMMGTHGSLMAKSSEKGKKVYPTVELKNYTGEAVIRCSLYQVDDHNRSPHTHHLVLRNAGNNEESNDPHDVRVDSTTGYVTVFPGMGIIHTAKKYIAAELFKKQMVMFNTRRIKLSQNQQQELRDRATQDARSMNLNSVCLCFEAFSPRTMEPLCEKVFSTPINNMKSALTGELKITRLSKNCSSCVGGDEIFIFVEKVGKKNIKVRFFEVDDNDAEIWDAFGSFSELDVHHQYAIALRTPAYHDQEIEHAVQVNIQLYRPSDGDVSDPIKFMYKPSQRISNSERKRARTGSCFNSSELMNNLPTVLLEQPHEDFYYNNSGENFDSFDKYLGGTTELMDSDEFKNFISSVPEDTKRLVFGDSDNPDLHIDGFISTDIVQPEGPPCPTVKVKSLAALTEDSPATKKNEIIKESIMDKNAKLNQTKEKQIIEALWPEAMPIRKPREIRRGSIEQKQMKPTRAAESRKSQLVALLKRSKLPFLTDDTVELAKIAKAVTDIYVCDSENGTTILHEAVLYDQLDISHHIISLLVTHNICDLLNKRNDLGQTALHIAVETGNYVYIKPLLAAGIDVNIADNDGNTPLHISIVKRNHNAIANLLNKSNYKSNDFRLDVNKPTSDGRTALHLATSLGQPETVSKLLLSKADINIPEILQGNTALHIAVEGNHEFIIRQLLACDNIQVNVYNRQGHTPLHLACVVDLGTKKGSDYVVKLLLEAKADPKLPCYSTCDSEIKEEPKSDDEDDDTDLTIESTTSFDLARSNIPILRLLTLYAEKSEKSYSKELLEKTDLETGPDLSTLVKEESSPAITFDDQCAKELCAILDKSGNWEKLAELLEYSAFMKDSDSPTKVLLGHIENAGTPLYTVIELLRALDEDEAVEKIDAMIARQTAV